MKVEQIQKSAEKAQEQYGLGNPVAIVYIYAEDVFVKGGDKGRDREYVSRQLIKCAADELNVRDAAA